MITKQELWRIREKLLDKISNLPPELQILIEKELNDMVDKLQRKNN